MTSASHNYTDSCEASFIDVLTEIPWLYPQVPVCWYMEMLYIKVNTTTRTSQGTSIPSTCLTKLPSTAKKTGRLIFINMVPTDLEKSLNLIWNFTSLEPLNFDLGCALSLDYLHVRKIMIIYRVKPFQCELATVFHQQMCLKSNQN